MEKKIVPPVQVIIVIVLMYFLTYLFPNFSYSLPGKYAISSLLISISICVGLLAIYTFRAHKTTINPTTPEATLIIVNTGIYALSRNPMYLAMVFLLISVSFLCENLLSFIPIPLFIWFITRFQIKPEEEALTISFESEYTQYCKDVRRWI
jgi:protein-S-isoprenylcysteine O-methyltransferase Ste14